MIHSGNTKAEKTAMKKKKKRKQVVTKMVWTFQFLFRLGQIPGSVLAFMYVPTYLTAALLVSGGKG